MARKKSQRVTLAQVAETSAVSVTTASLILSNKPESLAQFQQETIDRVRRVAEELGYRANLFASSLLAERSSFFCLVMRGGGRAAPETWRYSAYETEFLCGVTESPDAADIHPILAIAGAEADDDKARSIERIMAGGVFGTIVRSPAGAMRRCVKNRMNLGHPVVVAFPGHLEDWPSNIIDVDNIEMGRIAGRLLAAAGARRWLLVRELGDSTACLYRTEGLQALARECGATCDLVEPSPELDGTEPRSVVSDVLHEKRHDGIFGTTLRGSVIAMNACHIVGTSPGRDIALVGCDCAYWFNALDPRITSIDLSWFDAGAMAIRKLMEMIETREHRFENVLMTPRVVAGETCPVPAEI